MARREAPAKKKATKRAPTAKKKAGGVTRAAAKPSPKKKAAAPAKRTAKVAQKPAAKKPSAKKLSAERPATRRPSPARPQMLDIAPTTAASTSSDIAATSSAQAAMPAPAPAPPPPLLDHGATRSTQNPAELKQFAIDAARMLADDKCENIVLLDVRSLSQVSDYIIVASGTSDRQMRSSAEDVRKMAEQRGQSVFRTNEDSRSSWIVLDCVDVVVHLFEPSTRDHYDIEMLWGDAPRLEWERADQRSRDMAGLGGPKTTAGARAGR